MPHNNKTSASVLTAPLSVPKAIVSHELVKETRRNADGTKELVNTGQIKHQGQNVDPLTGQYTNPKRVQRKIRAAEKRARRNRGGRKQKVAGK